MSPSEITPRQRKVLEQLLQGVTVESAASTCQVSKRQIYRWLRLDDGFRSTLRQAQSVMLDAVGVRLVRLAETAVGVLEELMVTLPARQDAPGRNVQLRAALGVLDACIRWKDVLDFEDRLSELEKVVKNGNSNATKARR